MSNVIKEMLIHGMFKDARSIAESFVSRNYQTTSSARIKNKRDRIRDVFDDKTSAIKAIDRFFKRDL